MSKIEFIKPTPEIIEQMFDPDMSQPLIKGEVIKTIDIPPEPKRINIVVLTDYGQK